MRCLKVCIFSYDFNKLTMLYIHVHISISMTSKSGLTFFLSIKYLSVCLSEGIKYFTQKKYYALRTEIPLVRRSKYREWNKFC